HPRPFPRSCRATGRRPGPARDGHIWLEEPDEDRRQAHAGGSLPTCDLTRQTLLVSRPAFEVCAAGRDDLIVINHELGYRVRVALVPRGNPCIGVTTDSLFVRGRTPLRCTPASQCEQHHHDCRDRFPHTLSFLMSDLMSRVTIVSWLLDQPIRSGEHLGRNRQTDLLGRL